ncbi:MAG: hypothetical protein K6E30_07530 [Lachnospiraceae bacterium]|nr:hypothetical protein [Lachnospiraceae bacterium]
MSKTKLFQIGDFCFTLTYPEVITPPDNFMLFEVTGGRPSYSFNIEPADRIDRCRGTVAAKRENAVIFSENGLESRLIGTEGQDDYYAYYREISDNHAEIILAVDTIPDLKYDTVFNSLFALERHEIAYDSLILHCAYMDHHGKAVLFSAPSGTGKSTQADLWYKYRGKPTINGDRGLIQRTEKGWLVHGWPVCGSSGICHNISMPIRSIVMLGQAAENSIRPVCGVEAFRLLYSQITVNRWNQSHVMKAMDLIEKLLFEVPVFLLRCDISEDAVKCLEDSLSE